MVGLQGRNLMEYGDASSNVHALFFLVNVSERA